MGNVIVNTGTISNPAATAFDNQRKIDRTQNGVLWSIMLPNDSGQVPLGPALSYSTDNGVTWTAAGTAWPTQGSTQTRSFTPNASLFIDPDDYAHVAYKHSGDGYIYYLRGTPNAARTAYTWSAANLLIAATEFDYPDIVVHRDPATAGAWVAHVVISRVLSGGNNYTYYWRLGISSAGVVTKVVDAENMNAGGYAVTNHTYPSIDFNHTGDGKTVAGGTPHLYVGWSAGATGSGKGVRFRKATYASGSWTWGTEREIDNTHYYIHGAVAQTAFDGTRVIVSGAAIAVGGNSDLILHERDAADTTTTPRTLVSGTTYANQGTTYDTPGNVYFVGRDSSSGSQSLVQRKWTRATSTLSAPTTVDNATSSSNVTSLRRGPQGSAIDYVYTDGTASPYTVTSGRIVLNQNPTAPDLLTPADNSTFDSATDRTVTFRHNDPDGDPASAYAVWFRPAGTSVPYQALTGTTTVANGATITHTIPANTWPGVIAWYATTTDPSGAVSPPSAVRTVTGTPAGLAGATGGGGGTAFSALALYSATEVDRVQRVVGRTVKTTVTSASPLTITIDGGPVTATRNAGYTPTVGDLVEASYVTDGWVVRDKVVS